MKAAVVEQLGRSPVYTDFPDPLPRDGAVVATVEAAALTNLARGIVSGRHYSSSTLALPCVAGVDGVARLADGRRVYGTGIGPYGMMAEQTLIDPRAAIDVPEGLDAVTAAAAPNAGMSAWMALQHVAAVQPGSHVLVLGATGVTGSLAVQLAKLEFGVGRVVVVGRNADRLQWLRSAGADEVIALDDGLRDRIAAQHRRQPFDAVLDYLWGDPAEQALAALGSDQLMGGHGAYHATRYLQIGSMAGATITLPAGLLRSAAITIVGVGPGSVPFEVLVQLRTDVLPRVFAMVADGRLQLTTQCESLADVHAVWTRREPSGTRVVLRP